mmetsp:Transcript_7928/g.15401  ORF Transcript_7928/g.15401 Transcript_7928/m.15401 type:complete len:205 (+) Transcript_7928:2984-3598(+)
MATTGALCDSVIGVMHNGLSSGTLSCFFFKSTRLLSNIRSESQIATCPVSKPPMTSFVLLGLNRKQLISAGAFMISKMFENSEKLQTTMKPIEFFPEFWTLVSNSMLSTQLAAITASVLGCHWISETVLCFVKSKLRKVLCSRTALATLFSPPSSSPRTKNSSLKTSIVSLLCRASSILTSTERMKLSKLAFSVTSTVRGTNFE